VVSSLQVFWPKFHMHPISPMHAIWPSFKSYLPYHPNNTWSVQFMKPSVTSYLLCPNILLSTVFSHTLNVFFLSGFTTKTLYAPPILCLIIEHTTVSKKQKNKQTNKQWHIEPNTTMSRKFNFCNITFLQSCLSGNKINIYYWVVWVTQSYKQ